MDDVFELKYRDTLPVFEVVLRDPAPPGTLGPVHDLTGSTAWWLHVWLSDGTKLTRAMSKFGIDTAGTLRYPWIATDWDAGSGGPPFTVGGLIVGPSLPLTPGEREHRMEYEVLGPSTARMTFPNGHNSDGALAYHTLRIVTDIADGVAP